MEGSRARKVMLFVCIVLFGVITVGLLKLGFLMVTLKHSFRVLPFSHIC